MEGKTAVERAVATHDEEDDHESDEIGLEPEVIISDADQENISRNEDCNKNIDQEKSVKSKRDRKLVCDCGRLFPNHSLLVAHVAVQGCAHAPDVQKRPPSGGGAEEERTHFCPDCGKAFLRRNHLQRHEQTHSGVRPHVCGDCGVGFFRSEHLARHAKTHRDRDKDKYKCFVCSKTLTRPEHLVRHLKIHDRTRRQECRVCGEVFVLTQELLDHLQVEHMS